MASQHDTIINTDPNITQPDDFYETLINTHRDLTLEQSHLVNAKLILLLSNHIGDLPILEQALKKARQGIAPLV
jgi:Protein of unknown function (DUF2783)